MWSAGADVIDLYLGGRQVAACAGSRVLARVEVQAWVQGPAVATELLREAGRRRAVRVWLGAGVCRPFLVPAAAAGLAWADRARLLQGLARRTLGGEVGDCTLWVERGPAGGDRVAVAVAREVLTRACGVGIRAGARLLHIGPWWAEALRHALAQGAPACMALAVYEGDAVTLLRGRDGRFAEVRTLAPLALPADPSGLDAAVTMNLPASDDDRGKRTRWVRLLHEGRSPAPPEGWALSPMVEWLR